MSHIMHWKSFPSRWNILNSLFLLSFLLRHTKISFCCLHLKLSAAIGWDRSSLRASWTFNCLLSHLIFTLLCFGPRLTSHPSVPGPSQRRTWAGSWSRRSWMWVRLTPRLWPLSFYWGSPWCERWGWGCPCCQFWWKAASTPDLPRWRSGSSSRPAACWAGCTCSAALRSARPGLASAWPAAPGDSWSAALWHLAPRPSSCPLAPARPPGPSGSPGTSFWTHCRCLCGRQIRLHVCNALISSNRSPSYNLRRERFKVNICQGAVKERRASPTARWHLARKRSVQEGREWGFRQKSWGEKTRERRKERGESKSVYNGQWVCLLHLLFRRQEVLHYINSHSLSATSGGDAAQEAYENEKYNK